MKALALALIAFSLPAFAQTSERYFEHKSKGLEIHISLSVDGDSVRGMQFSGSDEPETHGASGPFFGNVRKDGLLHVTYNYEIEGNRQSEEQLLKLDGDTLFVGSGELEEHGPGQMALKDSKSVKFEKALKEVSVKEIETDKEECKAFTQVLHEPLAKLVGAPVVLNGGVRVSQKWARFTGNVRVQDGKTAKDKATSEALDRASFWAYLKDDGNGGWKVVRFMFEDAGDLSVPVEGLDFESKAPWVLEGIASNP